MSDFKGRHFRGEIVLWAVRWYCRYPISYRDLEAMMTGRGVAVDHSTIYRWVQRFAPEMEKRLRWQWRRPQSRSWRVDETYIKVRGKWAYLYRAVDKLGNTIDFYLSATRNTKAAKRFLGKALRGLKEWEQPEALNTDKAPAYAAAIAELKAEGKCPKDTRHRQVKYLNNVIEADHGKLKLLIRPVRGFKTMKTAYATIKGFEVMRALRKGQAGMFALQGGIVGEARIVERAFGLCQRRLKIRPKGGAKDCHLGWWSDLGVRLGVGDAVRGFFGGSGQRSHAELKRSAPAGRPQGGMVYRIGVSLATRALGARCRPGPSDGVPQFSYRHCFCGRGFG